MGLRDNFHSVVFDNLTQFIKMIRQVEMNSAIRQVMEHAPTAVTKGRTLQQIALDDAMSAFEDIMRSVSDKEIPVSFYLQMLRARDGGAVTPMTAATRMNNNLKTKRAALPSAAPMDEAQSDHIPDFLRLLFQQAPLNLVEALANEWSAVVQHFGQLTMRDEDFLARHKSMDIADSMARQVNDKLELRIKKEQLMRGMSGQPQPGAPKSPAASAGQDQRLQQLLAVYGEDLTDMARKGTLPQTIARDGEVTQVLAAVNQKDSPYALIVGPDGVGKSATTAGLAHRIVTGDVSTALKDAQLIRLKLKELKATSGQGQKQDARTGEASIIDQFNERLHYILSGVSAHNMRGGPQIILNITELSDMLPRIPGYFQSKDILAANMEKSGSLRLIAEIPEQKFNQVEVEARDLLQRFQTVRIKPMNLDNTVKLLDRDAAELKKATGVDTPKSLFSKIYKISTRFLPALAQPASSLNTLEAAVAYADVSRKKTVEEDHVVTVVSNLTGVPKEFIGSSMSERIKTLGEELPKKVMGQDTAIREIVESLEIANSNLQDAKKPLGSYLMVGPTGVGKSETAKALAEHLGVPLIVEDMANYMDQHAKAKLVGSPPGYIGFDKEASMEKVAKSPYCVLLLDEIEKAHTDIFNLLLSVLDEGRLQLMNGKVVDFKNCIILMSSNLGARDAEQARDRRPMGVVKKENSGNADANKAYTQAVENKLPPEFINRLDGILRYNRLDEAVVQKIAVKKIKQVAEFLIEKNPNLTLEFTKAAETELFKLGYDPRYGARPMDRAVKKYLKTPLSKWLVENGDNVKEPTKLLVKSLEKEFDMTPEKIPAPKP